MIGAWIIAIIVFVTLTLWANGLWGAWVITAWATFAALLLTWRSWLWK